MGLKPGALKNTRGRQPKLNGPVSFMYGTVYFDVESYCHHQWNYNKNHTRGA